MPGSSVTASSDLLLKMHSGPSNVSCHVIIAAATKNVCMLRLHASREDVFRSVIRFQSISGDVLYVTVYSVSWWGCKLAMIST